MRSERGLRGLILASLTLAVLAGCSIPGDSLGPQEETPGEATLAVDLRGSGSGTVTSEPAGIDCGDDCTALFPAGTSVVLTAIPEAGSVFSGWLGACPDSGVTCDLTISGDSAITAIFSNGIEGGDDGTGDDEVPGGDQPADDPPTDDSPDDFAPYGEQITKQSGVRDGNFHHGFGATVDISGEYAIVGAPGEEGSSAGGAVFIFESDGRQWEEAAHFPIPEEITASTTGWAVAVSDSYAAANYDCFLDHPECSGNGFLVFERRDGGWVRVARFSSDEPGPAFGHSLEFSGDYLFAGAAEDEFGQLGLVHIYLRTDGVWQLHQTLTQFAGDGDRFGDALAANDEYLAVGSDTGAHIYQLRAGRWEYLETVDVPSDDDFRDVAINDRWLTSSWAAAKVYRLQEGRWEPAGEIFGPGEVALVDDDLLLGFPADDTKSADAGSVRIYRWNGAEWEQVNEIFASDPAAGAGFGFAVAATPDHAVVGTDSGFGDDSAVGAAYFFSNVAAD